jgi:SET domain-containing protein
MARTSTTTKRTPRLEVRESTIHGKGLYARDRIARGARIIEYTGERVSAYEDASSAPASGPVHTVLFDLGNGWMIDGANGGNDARFINHSCRPNSEAYVQRGRIFIYARRTILAGHELLLDYGFSPESVGDLDARLLFPCRCGAPGCRGTIVAAA